jgi:hypothetical protein
MSRARVTAVLACIPVIALSAALVLRPGVRAGADAAAPQAATLALVPVGTELTYQGQLTEGGALVSGTYDFTFELFAAGTGGAALASTTLDDVGVADGIFSVGLDFGSAQFKGDARFLEIAVRAGDSSGAYATLTPRQALTAVPYALALPGLYTLANGASPSVIGGHPANIVAASVVGAVLAGGGAEGEGHYVGADFGAIGGGSSNTVTGKYATVGGGYRNLGRSDSSTVAGGWDNSAEAYGVSVGGGSNNRGSGDRAVIGGGYSNATAGELAVIGGGSFNNVAARLATIAGGSHISVTGQSAAVGGGESITVTGKWATVPGGSGNLASADYALAAGRLARAQHQGAFVWADSQDQPFSSAQENELAARATGGVRLVLAVDASGNPTWVCSLASGGSWACSSDRNLKTDLAETNGLEVLENLDEVTIYTWSARDDPASVSHIGPMAQDFHAAFGVGKDDVSISTIDLDGVALAAIQGLHRIVQEQDEEIDALRQSVAQLDARLAALEAAAPASAGVATDRAGDRRALGTRAAPTGR